MSSNNKDIAYAAMGFGYGIWAFFKGFKELRRKRLIENIPTSTVRGLAMGLVELEGKASPTTLLRSPLSNTECAAYKYEVEEYRSSGKSGHWVTIVSGDSFHCPFWLQDTTGKVMVYPMGAEMFWKPSYSFQTGPGSGMPEDLVRFMEQNGIQYHSWWGTHTMRFKEWCVFEGSTVYALGTAQKADDAYSLHMEKLSQRLEEIKKDPKKRQEIDTDKDGTINEEEWVNAVKNIESEVIQKTMNAAVWDNAQGIKIARDEIETTFIISESSQKELLQELSRYCWLCIYGGPALSLVTLAYLIFRLKMVWFSK
jgi:hypothetical protein